MKQGGKKHPTQRRFSLKKVLIVGLFLLVSTLAEAALVSQAGFNYTPVQKVYTTTSDQALTDQAVWTPTSGKKITLLGIAYTPMLASTMFLEQSTTKIIPETAVTASGNLVIGNGTPIWRGSADQVITITTNATCEHSILLWGYED